MRYTRNIQDIRQLQVGGRSPSAYPTEIIIPTSVPSSTFQNFTNALALDQTDSTETWISVDITSSGQYISSTSSNFLYSSQTYGSSWMHYSSNSIGSRAWYGISLSSDGKIQVAAPDQGFLYLSSDYGITWNELVTSTSQFWSDVCLSASNGQYITALSQGSISFAFVSSDFGSTFTKISPSFFGSGKVAISLSGKYQSIAVIYSSIFISSDYGSSWSQQTSIQMWYDIAMSIDNGIYQTACVGYGALWVSSDNGISWQSTASSQLWYSVAMTSDGKIAVAVVYSGFGYISNDYGATWNINLPYNTWMGISLTPDALCTLLADNSNLYLSNNCAVFFPTSNPTVYPTFQPSKPTVIPTTIPTRPTIYPSYIPTASITFTPTNMPSTLPSFAPSTKPSTPSIVPSLVPTSFPSMRPSFNVDQVLIYANISIDNYISFSIEPVETSVDESTRNAIVYSSSRSLDLQDSSYCSCNKYGMLYKDSLYVTIQIFYPREGIYAYQSLNELLILTTQNLNDAIELGTFTNLLQYASRLYKSQSTLKSTVTTIPIYSDPIVIKGTNSIATNVPSIMITTMSSAFPSPSSQDSSNEGIKSSNSPSNPLSTTNIIIIAVCVVVIVLVFVILFGRFMKRKPAILRDIKVEYGSKDIKSPLLGPSASYN